MSNQVVSQSHPERAAALRYPWSELFRHWQARRQVRKLQDRDDHILDDIGVTRDEVAWASQLPLSVNAAHELEQASYCRRKEQQLMWL